jgi:hypothetical protein
MNKITKYLGVITILLFAGTFLYTQEQAVDRVTVPFSNPSKPGKLDVSVQNGGITIKGYNGKEVIIEARVRERKVGEKVTDDIDTAIRTAVRTAVRLDDRARRELEQLREEGEEKKSKLEGLRRIPVPGGTGLEVEEEDNVMEVHTQAFRQAVDVVIQAPFNTTLELSSMNNGIITVENITGEVEVSNMNGPIKLSGISGTVVAHSMNGSVTVALKSVTPDKPMSFSTMNGDIDVTLPANIKAKVKMKSEWGEVYSDFDIQLDTVPQKVEEKEEGKYRISFEKYIMGTINGGGPEYTFKTYHGDIIIRKAK